MAALVFAGVLLAVLFWIALALHHEDGCRCFLCRRFPKFPEG